MNDVHLIEYNQVPRYSAPIFNHQRVVFASLVFVEKCLYVFLALQLQQL